MKIEMNGGIRNALKAFRLVLLYAGLTAPAYAQDLAIDAFYGRWSGTGVSESNISVNFRLTSRDLDVNIQPDGGAFVVDWTTVQRQKGNPNDPTPVRKGTLIRFVATDRANVWKAEDLDDPLQGGRYAWARIKKQTLSIHTMTISDDGGYEMQVYHRTLLPFGMDLEFVSFRNGEARRLSLIHI